MTNQNNSFNWNKSLITKEELISIIEEALYSEEKIKKEIFLKTFKTCGLTNIIDGTEDDIFIGKKKILVNKTILFWIVTN